MDEPFIFKEPIPFEPKNVAKLSPALEPERTVGEFVRLLSGPFNGFTGEVEDIDPDKGQIKVMVNVFGRSTPVLLNFCDVEKLNFSQ